MGVIRGNMVSNNFYSGKTGVLADGSPCGGANPACPPGRQYVSTGILLVLIDPNSIQRGQNDVSNGNQRNYAVITDSPLDESRQATQETRHIPPFLFVSLSVRIALESFKVTLHH